MDKIDPMRRYVYLFVALLLLAFTLESAREISSFQRASAEREYRRAEDLLERLVTRWEDDVVAAASRWLQLVDRRMPNELNLRRTYPWFEGIYTWEPGELHWPPRRVDEDLGALRKDPCIAAADNLPEGTDSLEIAGAFIACIGRSPQVSLLAASDAAELLNNADQGALAESVIRRVEPLLRGDPGTASLRGLPIRRLVLLRLQYIRSLELQGQSGQAQYQVLANELLRLDGESLEGVIDYLEYPVLAQLQGLRGEEEEWLLRAKRRVQVLRAVRDRPWEAEAPDLENGPRLYVDPVGDPPYLLLYAKSGTDDARLSAIQVDQGALIQNLYEWMGPHRRWVSIRESGGRVLAGSTGQLGPVMAFTRVLPHLRVGLDMGWFAENAPPTSLLGQTLPMLLGLFTGGAALLALIRTDRQQNDLMEQQREFMARVTHELKTPLAGIRLMAETLEMGLFKDTAQREKFARQIIKEAERLEARVNEVLKAANRPVEEKSVPVDLDEMARQLTGRWKDLYEQQGAALILEAPPPGQEVGTVLTGPALLRDALTNLIDNALKYRREDRPGKVIFRLIPERRHILFEVEDNGIGVPPGMRKAIFERFRRVEGPGRGRSGGHGLGLYFVAEAARLLGGKVECREGAEGGARFLLRIPRRDP